MNNELKKQIELFLSGASVERVLTDKIMQAQFVELHYSVFGSYASCPSCPNKVRAALEKLRKVLDNPNYLNSTNMTCEFKNPATQVYSRYGKTIVTAATLTENNAIGILASNPKNVELFKTLPDGWEEKVADMKAKEEGRDQRKADEAKAAEAKKAELKAAAEQASNARKAAASAKKPAAKAPAPKAEEATKKTDVAKGK